MAKPTASRFLRCRCNDGSERLLIRQSDTGRVGRRHDDEPVLLRKPVGAEGVHFVERDPGKEPAVKRELLPDGGKRFAFEEVTRVLGRTARRFAIGALHHHAFGARHVCLLRAIELGRSKAESFDPLELGDERVEAVGDPVVRHQRLQCRLISRPRRREELTIGGGIEERRVRTLGQFRESCTDQRGEQLVCEDRPVAADRALVARRSKIRNLYGRRCRFLVRDDHVPRAGVLRHVERRSGTLR